MHKYRLISKKGEGTFSEVLKAQSTKTNKYVAIKCMKAHFYNIDQVNNLREIQALKRLSPHPNIITLHEVLYDEPTGRLALVFELMDMNMYEAIKGRRHYLPEQRVKYYMYQVLKAIDHMHRNGIFHRDIKPENILLKEDQVKLADFGSCRGVYSQPPFTEYISTRWYRPPECLLTDGYYNHKMDYWGVGCVYFEILALFPLFPGNNELDQVHKVHNILGTPGKELLAKFQRVASHMEFNFDPKPGTGIAKLIPNVTPEAQEIITKLLIYDNSQRMSAGQALKHVYFKDLREMDKSLPENTSISTNPQGMRLTNRGADSFSNNSKSMSKISDNASEGSYHGHEQKKKQNIDKQRHNKQGHLGANSSVGGISDLKVDGGKNQTFHSDMEEYSNAAGGTVPIIGGQQQALPPIVMPTKKGGKKKHVAAAHQQTMATTFNSTKKQFPQLNKLNQHKKSYVSPYSIKSISKP